MSSTATPAPAQGLCEASCTPAVLAALAQVDAAGLSLAARLQQAQALVAAKCAAAATTTTAAAAAPAFRSAAQSGGVFRAPSQLP